MRERPRREDERLHWPIVNPYEIKLAEPPPRDWPLTVMKALTAIAWLLIIGFLLMIAYARPEDGNFFSRVLAQGRHRQYWDYTVLRTASFLLNGALVLCVTGLLLAARRSIVKSQRMFSILGSVSLAGSIVSWLLFF